MNVVEKRYLVVVVRGLKRIKASSLMNMFVKEKGNVGELGKRTKRRRGRGVVPLSTSQEPTKQICPIRLCWCLDCPPELPGAWSYLCDMYCRWVTIPSHSFNLLFTQLPVPFQFVFIAWFSFMSTALGMNSGPQAGLSCLHAQPPKRQDELSAFPGVSKQMPAAVVRQIETSAPGARRHHCHQ